MDEQISCLQQFIDHYSSLLHDNSDSLHKEYRVLRDEGCKMVANTEEYKRSAGSIATNRAKNRYRDILPFDATRVKLSMLADSPYSDYINANFVKGIYGTNAYIGSQAPLPHTTNDFWRMIWELDVRVVLMACNEYEANKAKCARYWPNDGDSAIQFGNINITVTSVDVRDGGELLVRRLQAECDSTTRTVMQYHYTAWPDHGIPQNMTPILDMLGSARSYQPQDEPPIVVHCSAGCGRTGTLIAIDYIRNLLNEERITEDLSVLNLLIDMRKQRQSLIQTPEQYETVYRAVRELFQHKVSTQENHLYENLSTVDQSSKRQKTRKSMKESSAIAQNYLSALSADVDGQSEEEAPPPPVPNKLIENKAPRLSNTSHRYKAAYVNTEEEGLFKVQEKSPEKATKPKPTSATISIGRDNEAENPTKAKPLPTSKPRPAIASKPSLRQHSKDSHTTPSAYSLAGSIDIAHSSLPSPTNRQQPDPENISSASMPTRTQRKKYTHRYSEVDDSQFAAVTESKDALTPEVATYHLAGEMAVSPEPAESNVAGQVTGSGLTSAPMTYSLAGEETNAAHVMTYHLAGEMGDDCTNQPESKVNEGSAFAQSQPDDDEAYSYADLGDPRFGRQRLQQQNNNIPVKKLQLATSLNGPGKNQYLLADEDDDSTAPPPLPVKTDGAFVHDGSNSYSPVEVISNDVIKDGRHNSASMKKSTLSSPGLFKPFQKILELKPKTKTLPPVYRHSSNSSSHDEIMYRGLNMAYPNKVKALAGERSMPMSFKR